MTLIEAYREWARLTAAIAALPRGSAGTAELARRAALRVALESARAALPIPHLGVTMATKTETARADAAILDGSDLDEAGVRALAREWLDDPGAQADAAAMAIARGALRGEPHSIAELIRMERAL